MLLDNLPHAVTVYRPTHSQGGLGGTVPTLVERETGLACWIQPAKGGVITEYRRRDQIVSHSIYFLSDPGLEIGDWLLPETGSFRAGKLLKFVDNGGAGAGLLELYRADVFEDREAPDMPVAGDETE